MTYTAWLIPAGGGKGREVTIEAHRFRSVPKSQPQQYAPPKQRGGKAQLIPKKTRYHVIR